MASRVQIWENNSAQRNIRKVEKSLDFRLWVWKNISFAEIFREFQFYYSIYWHKRRLSAFSRRILLTIFGIFFYFLLDFFLDFWPQMTSGHFMLHIDSHAFGKDSRISFNFRYFLGKISPPISFKILATLNLSHLCKLLHRKKTPPKFPKIHFSRMAAVFVSIKCFKF